MSTDADPVSWLLVEPGWQVLASGGVEAGFVHEVLGEPELGIFDGLVVTHKPPQRRGRDPLGDLYRSAVGLRDLDALTDPPRYLPAGHVQRIVEGYVEVALDVAGVERLEPYSPGR